MSKKKSYMDRSNILTEGFFDVVKNILAVLGAKYVWDKTKKETVKKSLLKNLMLKASVFSINRDVRKFEKLLKKDYGADIDFGNWKMEDFE